MLSLVRPGQLMLGQVRLFSSTLGLVRSGKDNLGIFNTCYDMLRHIRLS
jgi:hypothetical protein